MPQPILTSNPPHGGTGSSPQNPKPDAYGALDPSDTQGLDKAKRLVTLLPTTACTSTDLTRLISKEFDPNLHASLDLQKMALHLNWVKKFWPEITSEAAEEFPEFASLYGTIKAKNIPNFLGARTPLKSDLNLDKWDEMLELYHDKEICNYLRFGWPVGYEADSPPSTVEENHHSGRQYLDQVKKFC